MIYAQAMAVARQQAHRTLPRFTPDPPWRTWVEPCACLQPQTDHPAMLIGQGVGPYVAHLGTIYRHGWRYGKGRTAPSRGSDTAPPPGDAP